MKYPKLMTLATSVCCYLLICSNAAAQYATCTSSASDPDANGIRDGWGWENNQSCQVDYTQITNPAPSAAALGLFNFLKDRPNHTTNRVVMGQFGGYSGITGADAQDAFSMTESDRYFV